ncbi:unnamed protein product [Wickerhamomyces anomalus]
MNENNSSFQKLPELEASNERLTLVVEYQANNREEFVERLAELLEKSETIPHHKKVIKIKQFKGSQIKKTLSWDVEGENLVRRKEITNQDGHLESTAVPENDGEGLEAGVDFAPGMTYSLSLSKGRLLSVTRFEKIFTRSKLDLNEVKTISLIFLIVCQLCVSAILWLNDYQSSGDQLWYFIPSYIAAATSVEILCYYLIIPSEEEKATGKSESAKRLTTLKIVGWSITLIGFVIFIGIRENFFQK